MPAGFDDFQAFAPQLKVLAFSSVKPLFLEKLSCQLALFKPLSVVMRDILLSFAFQRPFLHINLPYAKRFPDFLKNLAVCFANRQAKRRHDLEQERPFDITPPPAFPRLTVNMALYCNAKAALSLDKSHYALL
jgi:hypothetical protein